MYWAATRLLSVDHVSYLSHALNQLFCNSLKIWRTDIVKGKTTDCAFVNWIKRKETYVMNRNDCLFYCLFTGNKKTRILNWNKKKTKTCSRWCKRNPTIRYGDWWWCIICAPMCFVRRKSGRFLYILMLNSLHVFTITICYHWQYPRQFQRNTRVNCSMSYIKLLSRFSVKFMGRLS